MLFNKNYFPVGSVVGVKDDSRRLLIVGRQLYSETNQVIRDYTALEYPNGFISADKKFILFDHKDIVITYHYGYVDEKEVQLDKILTEKSKKEQTI